MKGSQQARERLNAWALGIREMSAQDRAKTPGSAASEREVTDFLARLQRTLGSGKKRQPGTVRAYTSKFADGLRLRGTYIAEAEARLTTLMLRLQAPTLGQDDTAPEAIAIDAGEAFDAVQRLVTKATAAGGETLFLALRLQATLSLSIGVPGLRGTSIARIRWDGWKATTVAEPHTARPVTETWPVVEELLALNVPQSGPDKGAQLRASNTASITRIPVMATLSEHQCAARLLLRFRRQPDVIARNAKCNGDHLFFSSRVAGGHYNPLSVTTIRARICDLFDEVATAATPHFRLGRKSAVMYNITNGLAPGDIATLQVWRDTATMTQHYNLSAASRVAQEQRAAADARNAQPAPLSETRPTGPTATVGEIEDEISSQPTPPMGLSTRPVTGPSGSSALAAVPARVVRGTTAHRSAGAKRKHAGDRVFSRVKRKMTLRSAPISTDE